MTAIAYLDSRRRDARLEQEIIEVRARMLAATRSDVQHIYADCLSRLVSLRSPDQVARMEAEKGLQ